MTEENYKYRLALVSRPIWLDEVPGKIGSALEARIANEDLLVAPYGILRDALDILDRRNIKSSENSETGETHYQTQQGVHVLHSNSTDESGILEFITLESNSILEAYRLSNEMGIGKVYNS